MRSVIAALLVSITASALAAGPPEIVGAPPAPIPIPAGAKPALAPLRPAGADALLNKLVAAPTDADAYRAAAMFYASSDARGMAIIYGLHALALGPAKDDGAVATAIVDALARGITVEEAVDGKGRSVSVSLAPGEMPLFVLGKDVTVAPLCHRFELAFALPLVTHFEGRWKLASVAKVVRDFVTTTMPKPADLELFRWLNGLAQSEALEAWLGERLGAAFAAERPAWTARYAEAAKALGPWLATHPFAPSRAPMPDELIAFRP